MNPVTYKGGESLNRVRIAGGLRIFAVIGSLAFVVAGSIAQSATPSQTVTQKLAVTNFIDKPEVNLGSQYKDRKAQCSVIDFELTGFDLGNINQKKIVINKLQSLGIEIADDLDAFKRIDSKGWSKTAIYLKTTTGACPAGTEAFKLSQGAQAQPTTTVIATATATSLTSQCAHDDKTISVAINNYPGNVTDHASYYKKFNEMNWRCSIKKIPVSKPAAGIGENVNEIKAYLAKNAPDIKVVADKAEFDKLSGDDMKKAVVLSSLKCQCDGPNSIDYGGIFKDGTKIESRPDTSYKGGLQIGADMNPNNPSVQGPSSNGSASGQGLQSGTAPASPSGTVGGDPGHSFTSSDSDKPDKNGACLVKYDVTVCFADKRTQELNNQGKLTSMVEIAAKTISDDTNRTSDHSGTPGIVMFATPSTLKTALRDQGLGATCTITGGCKVLADNTLGEAAVMKIWGEANAKNAPAQMIIYSYTFFDGMGANDMARAWDAAYFKSAIDHEWAHSFDMTSDKRASCNGAASAMAGDTTFVSCNKSYGPFLNVYSGLIKAQASRSAQGYPTCVKSMLGSADHGEHVSDPGGGPTELFASTFQAYNNRQNIGVLNSLMNSSGGECKSNMQTLLSSFDKLLKPAQ